LFFFFFQNKESSFGQLAIFFAALYSETQACILGIDGSDHPLNIPARCVLSLPVCEGNFIIENAGVSLNVADVFIEVRIE